MPRIIDHHQKQIWDSDYEYQQCLDYFDRLSNFVYYTYGYDIRFTVFGSFHQETDSYYSDCDAFVVGIDLASLAAKLEAGREQLGIVKFDYFARAKVPIIKLGTSDGRKYDICARCDGVKSIQSGGFIRHLLYIRRDIRLMVRKTKELFHQNGTYLGSNHFLGGYALTILVCWGLQSIGDLEIFSPTVDHKNDGYWNGIRASVDADMEDDVITKKLTEVFKILTQTGLRGCFSLENHWRGTHKALYIESPVNYANCGQSLKKKREMLNSIYKIFQGLQNDPVSLLTRHNS